MSFIFSLFFIFNHSSFGFLTVLSDRGDVPVYVDGLNIGRTPINKHPLKPGKYTVSFFPEDSFDFAYERIKFGSLTQKLSALWQLARYSAGTERVRIAPDTLTEVFISKLKVDKAQSRAKRNFFFGVSTIFLFGFISGFLLNQAF